MSIRHFPAVLCLVFSAALLAAPTIARAASPRKPASKGTARLASRGMVKARPPHKQIRRADAGLSAGARSPQQNPLEKAALEISDLKSGENVVTVRRALQEIEGVKTAIIDMRTGLAVVDYDPARTELAAFLTACEEAGFPAVEYRVESRFPKPIKLKGG